METTYQRKSVGVSNERFVEGSQNALESVAPLTSITAGRRSRLKRSKHGAQQSERLALLGISAAAFAHEVANPLSGISVALEFVRRSLESAEFDVRHLTVTLQGAMVEINRLGSLLNDFRDIASPQNIDFQRTDLVKKTEDVLSCQYDAYRKLGITVEIHFDNPLPPGDGGRRQDKASRLKSL